ncbi:MAG: pyridoxamine 5'-phosphate oxidase family protein [Pirellulales bacterium]
MSLERFQQPVLSTDELAALVGSPGPLALKKELPHLDDNMRRFIAHSPFAVVSSYGASGRCDASPRGDGPGFVRVVDDKTLVIPERAGNKRTDTMRNVIETGRIGLIFFIPGFGETLRINGRARVIRDADILGELSVQGKTPLVGIAVEAEECFLQCARSILRSKLWEGSVVPSEEALPCAAEMLAEQAKSPEFTKEGLQQSLDKAYSNLY